jgi:hypothetical protein
MYHWALGEAEPSPAMWVDFGIDNNEIALLYVRKINSGEITREQLHEALGDSVKLGKLLGVELKQTSWDILGQQSIGK